MSDYPVAVLDQSLFSLIEVTGADASRFLQAQTTSDVRSLKPGQGQASALLDNKARVQAYFYLYYALDQSCFYIVSTKEQSAKILEHLQKFTFADRVDYRVLPEESLILSGTKAFIELQPLLGDSATAATTSSTSQPVDMHVAAGLKVFRVPLAPCTTCVIFAKEQLAAIRQTLSLPTLTREQLTARRVEAGVAQLGVDYTDCGMVELSLSDPAISYTKGCYQGQEVIARVKLQGTPAKQITGLTLSSAIDQPLGSDLILDGQVAGQLLSHSYSATLGRYIALAMLKRDCRTPGKTLKLTIGNQSVEAIVTVIPFVQPQSDSDLAKILYDEALQDFAAEKNEIAITKLKEAIALAPAFEDAWESLGVIISKTPGHTTQEAIEVMNELVKINPDSVMAHTNLSVFWVELGDKERAEEEKAISMSIRMQQAAKQATEERKSKEDKEALVKETEERMKMFAEVLKIDSEDLFANQGLGNCHNTLGNHAEALKYLQKAIEIKANHTQTYEELATAYLGLGDIKNASQALEKGIEIAAVKGDMTPLKAMQERLESLKQTGKK